MIRKVCSVSYTELLRHMSTIVQDVVNARLPARPPTYLSACLSVGRRSVRLSVCLPVCLSPSSCMSVSLCLLVFNCLIDSLFVRMAVSLFDSFIGVSLCTAKYSIFFESDYCSI